MKNNCCQIWSELTKELSQERLSKITKAIEEQPLLSSAFSPMKAVLNQMDNYCPVCGHDFYPQQAEVVEVSPRKPVVPEKKTGPVLGPCRACKGKGVLGTDKEGDPVNCSSCLGKGKLLKADQVKKNAVSQVTGQSYGEGGAVVPTAEQVEGAKAIEKQLEGRG